MPDENHCITQTSALEKVTGIKVFFLGMMGSGKSFWAEKLKKKLKVPAYDLDNLVEIMEERTIAEIFDADGEDYFRKEEAKMLRLFKEKKQFLLSCGGGTPCFMDNMQWMNKRGITIWLDEPVENLVLRLTPEKDHRPLISKLGTQELSVFLENKLMERQNFYTQARYHLQGAQITEQHLLTIIRENE